MFQIKFLGKSQLSFVWKCQQLRALVDKLRYLF
jgi:hypothetical protein